MNELTGAGFKGMGWRQQSVLLNNIVCNIVAKFRQFKKAKSGQNHCHWGNNQCHIRPCDEGPHYGSLWHRIFIEEPQTLRILVNLYRFPLLISTLRSTPCLCPSDLSSQSPLSVKEPMRLTDRAQADWTTALGHLHVLVLWEGPLTPAGV